MDADRFPTLKCYDETAQHAVFVRISTDYERSEEDGHVDGLGLAQRVYAPHKTEILQENDGDATAPTTAYRSLAAQILAECSKNGTKIVGRAGEGVQAASDYAAADTAADEKLYEIRSDDIHPLTSQM